MSPSRLTPEVLAYLDSLEMSEGEAREPLTGVCGCSGSPLGWGDDGNTPQPCYCELVLMKRQQVLGLPVVGWGVQEVPPPRDRFIDWHELSDEELAAELRRRQAKVTMPSGEVVPIFSVEEDGIDEMVSMRSHPGVAARIDYIIGR